MTSDRAQLEYVLILRDGSKKEFSAEGASQALTLAKSLLPAGKSALLVENGNTLAEISYTPDGFWSVSDSGAAAFESTGQRSGLDQKRLSLFN